MCLLRATKNLKNFSKWSLGPQEHSTILVWPCHYLLEVCVVWSVKNGGFLSFQNSAGVLVQTWNRIFMSKFEVFLMRTEMCYSLGNLQNYVSFKNMYPIFQKISKILKFWEFSIFFIFWKFPLDLQANLARFFGMSKFVQIFMCHMCKHQNIYLRHFFDA